MADQQDLVVVQHTLRQGAELQGDLAGADAAAGGEGGGGV
jgi:hypothetical protein